VAVHIEDDDDLGDERIQPGALRRLLQARPDLSVLLLNCLEEENLLQFKPKEEDEDD
jgi:hypothetical protein